MARGEGRAADLAMDLRVFSRDVDGSNCAKPVPKEQSHFIPLWPRKFDCLLLVLQEHHPELQILLAHKWLATLLYRSSWRRSLWPGLAASVLLARAKGAQCTECPCLLASSSSPIMCDSGSGCMWLSCTAAQVCWNSMHPAAWPPWRPSSQHPASLRPVMQPPSHSASQSLRGSNQQKLCATVDGQNPA